MRHKNAERFNESNLEDYCTVSEALSRSLNVMRTTIHSSINETLFERHYGRKPRTEITSYLYIPTDINEIVSARLETLKVYSFNNGDGEYDQLIMKAPRKLKCDVSNKFPYQFLEKKKQNKNKFESNYEAKPQTDIAGTKHIITTDTNKIIHQKLLRNPLPNAFQNPLSRRGENRRGPDGKFAQKSAPQVEEEDTEEGPEEIEPEEIEEQDPSTPNTSIETLDDSFDFAATIQVGRGRKKQPQSTKPNTPGKDNLKMHVENMNKEQLQQARETIAENPSNVTIIDNNGNDDNYNIKTELIEPENNNNVQVRRSNRIKTTNLIIRLGNPLTH